MAVIEQKGPATPIDDKKKRVSDVLKRVDMLIKQGDLQQALLETNKAKEIDPKNVYAFAFEERIAALLKKSEEQAAKKAEAPTPVVSPPTPSPAPAPIPAPTTKAIPQPIQVPKAPPPPSVPPPPHSPPAPPQTVAPKPPAMPAPAQPVPPAPRQVSREAEADIFEKLRKQLDSYASYRKALAEVWADGAATPEERTWLDALRSTLAIKDEDHQRIEHEVQLEAYLNTLKSAYTHGRINPSNASILSEMRLAFQISQEDHDKIEARFLTELQAHEKHRATIVVIDDDKKVLDVICDTLRDADFATLPFTTSDEAYAYLKAGSTPDLILCDVNLETSTMGGFSFYEKIQWLEHLTEVPFILLTGLTDEVLVRTGKELGVDDYLTKPISDQTLVATIRGKLKRFKRLKTRS